MKTKILFITFVVFFLISCGKEEQEVKIPIKPKVVEVVKVIPPAIVVEKVEVVNPLSKYISDEVYNEGVEIFQGDNKNMFTQDAEEFSDYEKFKSYIEARFKPTMLITQNGINSAVVYYLENGSKNRAMINGFKTIEIEGVVYYINVFKDKIEIKKGKNGRAVPLYLRER